MGFAKNLKDPALIRSLLFLETNFLKDLLFTRYQSFPVQTGFFCDFIPQGMSLAGFHRNAFYINRKTFEIILLFKGERGVW